MTLNTIMAGLLFVALFLLSQLILSIWNWDVISLYQKYHYRKNKGKFPEPQVLIKYVKKKPIVNASYYEYDVEHQRLKKPDTDYDYFLCFVDMNSENREIKISEHTFTKLAELVRYGIDTYYLDITMSTDNVVQMCLDGFNRRVQNG